VLRTLGFDEPAIPGILRRYSPAQIQLWADVTLAALERKGKEFFKRSPQAFFVNNIREAATAGRTPPDWWLALRKEEERREGALDRRRRATAKDKPAAGNSRKPERAIDAAASVEQLVASVLRRAKSRAA
jgi:hypothetical protein